MSATALKCPTWCDKVDSDQEARVPEHYVNANIVPVVSEDGCGCAGCTLVARATSLVSCDTTWSDPGRTVG